MLKHNLRNYLKPITGTHADATMLCVYTVGAQNTNYALGKSVFKLNVKDSGKETLDASRWSEGLYLCKIAVKGTIVYSKKLLIIK